jgi:hypothetical protein
MVTAVRQNDYQDRAEPQTCQGHIQNGEICAAAYAPAVDSYGVNIRQAAALG